MKYTYENLSKDISDLENGTYWAYTRANNDNIAYITEETRPETNGPSRSNMAGELVHVNMAWKVRVKNGQVRRL